MDSYNCRTCHGNRTIGQVIHLHEVCPRCNGDGSVDWVTHAMGGRTDTRPSISFMHNLMQKNIHILMDEIKRQGSRVGVRIDVDIRMERESDLYERMMIRPQAPLIYPPGG